MLKKILYVFVLLLAFFFYYNIYINNSSKKVVSNKELVIETDNLVGKMNDRLNFQAEKAYEKGDGTKILEKVILNLKDGIIKCDQLIYQNDNDLTFKGNVNGELDFTNEGKISKWKFNGDTIRYLSTYGQERVEASGNFSASSESDNINIRANSLEAYSAYGKKEIENVYLKDTVELSSNNYLIKCDKMQYFAAAKLMEFFDNIKATFKQEKNKKRIIASSKYFKFKTDDEELSTDQGCTLAYNDISVTGNNFLYSNKSKDFSMSKQVTAESKKNKVKISFDSMFYDEKTNKINFQGNINGVYDSFDFVSDHGEVNTKSEELIFYSNRIKHKKEGINIDAPLLICKDDSVKMTGNGDRNSLIVLSKDDIIMQSKSCIIDSKKRIQTFKGDVKIETKDYIITTDEVAVDEKNRTVKAEKEFIVTNEKEKFKLIANSGSYNEPSGIMSIPGKLTVYKEDYLISAYNGSYSHKKSSGFARNLILKNSKEKMELLSDNITFEHDKSFKLEGNVRGRREELNLITSSIVYNAAEKKAHFAKDGIVENDEKNIKFTYNTAVFDTEKEELLATVIRGENEKLKFSADEATYKEANKKFSLSKNVRAERENLLLETTNTDYDTVNKEFVITDETDIHDKNLLFVVKKGKVNLESKKIVAENAVLIRDSGDIIESKYIEGDFNRKEFGFRENIKAKLTNGVTFTGDQAKIYLIQDKAKKDSYKILRGEIKKNAEFKHENIILSSNFIEMDNDKKLVYSRDKTRVKVIYTDGNADISAGYVFFDFGKSLGRLKSKVHITSNNKKYGTINCESEEAILKTKDKIIGLRGNVKSYGNKSNVEIHGDDGELDLEKGIITNKGAAGFKYVFDKKDDKEELKAEEDEELAKIEKANKSFLG